VRKGGAPAVQMPQLGQQGQGRGGCQGSGMNVLKCPPPKVKAGELRKLLRKHGQHS
jgi:predicted metal-binding protein